MSASNRNDNVEATSAALARCGPEWSCPNVPLAPDHAFRRYRAIDRSVTVTNDNSQDFEIEYSSLCGYFTEDGVRVRVVICRLKGSDDEWSLEVIDDQETSTAWDVTFPTEADAYKEFYATLNREGIRSFLT